MECVSTYRPSQGELHTDYKLLQNVINVDKHVWSSGVNITAIQIKSHKFHLKQYTYRYNLNYNIYTHLTQDYVNWIKYIEYPVIYN